jgi:hypothetical protein
MPVPDPRLCQWTNSAYVRSAPHCHKPPHQPRHASLCHLCQHQAVAKQGIGAVGPISMPHSLHRSLHTVRRPFATIGDSAACAGGYAQLSLGNANPERPGLCRQEGGQRRSHCADARTITVTPTRLAARSLQVPVRALTTHESSRCLCACSSSNF